MNWLAHTLLSKKNISYQLGNVLADPLKGKAWKGVSKKIVEGMKMHKEIDKFTDKHFILSASKSKLGGEGHLKGVVLDILYDHFLSISWDIYCSIDLNQYLLSFNQQAFEVACHFPVKAKTIVHKMVETNLLGTYKTFDGLISALERIDQRLSSRVLVKETTAQYIPVIEQQYQALKSDFEVFFPELVKYFKNHELGSVSDHYLL